MTKITIVNTFKKSLKKSRRNPSQKLNPLLFCIQRSSLRPHPLSHPLYTLYNNKYNKKVTEFFGGVGVEVYVFLFYILEMGEIGK